MTASLADDSRSSIWCDWNMISPRLFLLFALTFCMSTVYTAFESNLRQRYGGILSSLQGSNSRTDIVLLTIVNALS
jgi:hypothetical protein